MRDLRSNDGPTTMQSGSGTRSRDQGQCVPLREARAQTPLHAPRVCLEMDHGFRQVLFFSVKKEAVVRVSKCIQDQAGMHVRRAHARLRAPCTRWLRTSRLPPPPILDVSGGERLQSGTAYPMGASPSSAAA